MHNRVAFYVVNFEDEERKTKMTERCANIGVQANFVAPVYTTDPRIEPQPITIAEKRNWSIFYQHVDSMRDFVEKAEADYVVIMEDDVFIRKDLAERLPQICAAYDVLGLDVLLLSYLWPHDIAGTGNPHFPLLGETLDKSAEFYGYPVDLWGAHMYMMSRAHAKTLIAKFTPEYGLAQKPPNYFCSDWQITKTGTRGLIVPMMGVEEGTVKTDNWGQIDFHRRVYEYNYKEGMFY